MSKLPLAGIRVADFTWIGAGSYTTKLLADFGAEVIKVESSTRTDSLRSTAPFKNGVAGTNRSGYFADRNTSKRSIQLNLKHPEGPEIARALIAKSDIVANNFTPGTMEKFGLGYKDVAGFKRDIIYISMSMQGGSGPDAKYVGFGLTIAALTGLQYLSGQTDRPDGPVCRARGPEGARPVAALRVLLRQALCRHGRRRDSGRTAWRRLCIAR